MLSTSFMPFSRDSHAAYIPLVEKQGTHCPMLRAQSCHAFGSKCCNVALMGSTTSKWIATQLLLKQGADVDAPGPGNMTSLHRAAYNDHADVLEVLLDYGADAVLRDDDGWTALHDAASAGFVRSTSVLVEMAGHTLKARDNNGLTPFHHAARLKDVGKPSQSSWSTVPT